MPTLADIRKQHPEYDDLSDQQLADGLYRKFYADIPREQFDQKIGLAKTPESQSLVGDYGSQVAEDFMRGWSHLTGPRAEGIIAGPASTLARVTAPAEMLFSPLSALRAPAGRVLAGAEQAVGEPINRLLGGKAHPDERAMYEQAKEDVGKAMAAAGPGRTSVPVTGAPLGQIGEGVGADIAAAQRVREAAQSPPQPQPVVEAVDRLAAQDIATEIPRTLASESRTAQQLGSWLSKLPIVGTPIAKAMEKVGPSLEAGASKVAGELGTGEGPLLAGQVGSDLSGAAQAETQAAEKAAALADRQAMEAWDAQHRQRIGAIDQREAEATGAANQQFGEVNPQDMAQNTIARMQQAHDAAEAEKNRLYDVAGQAEGTLRSEAVGNARSHVAQTLDDAGVIIDDSRRDNATPKARNMMGELQRFSTLQSPGNLAVGARLPATGDTSVAGVSLQGVEQVRKKLNLMRSAADTPTDRRAANAVMNAFDDWRHNAMQNHLLSGDPGALDNYLAARRANTDLMNRFGYNGANDAEKLINRVVTDRDVTPNELVNNLIGAKPGEKGVSSRLLEGVGNATGNDPAVNDLIRGAVWNRLRSGAPEDIYRFTRGEGRDVARQLFNPNEHGLMENYSDVVRQSAQERKLADDIARNTKPAETEIQKGPIQELADRVLGTGRQKSDESLFGTMDAYAKSGNRGDQRTLATLLGRMTKEQRSDFGSAIIRGLGQKGKDFSLPEFVKDWDGYSDGAKAMIFGEGSAHRRAIDDIAEIAKRYRDVGRKYSSPSGPYATTAGFAALAVSNPIAALKAAGLAGTGWTVAKILASPAGASSFSKWSKVAEAVRHRPTPAGAAALRLATTNVANTANGLQGRLYVSPNRE